MSTRASVTEPQMSSCIPVRDSAAYSRWQDDVLTMVTAISTALPPAPPPPPPSAPPALRPPTALPPPTAPLPLRILPPTRQGYDAWHSWYNDAYVKFAESGNAPVSWLSDKKYLPTEPARYGGNTDDDEKHPPSTDWCAWRNRLVGQYTMAITRIKPVSDLKRDAEARHMQCQYA